ncbi:MAG: hypothetical protein AB7O97_17345 [Planctomycetota bacterium]
MIPVAKRWAQGAVMFALIGAAAAQWQQLGPAVRTSGAVAFDAARGRVTLFGGVRTTGLTAHYLDDTWVFESGSYRLLPTATTPTKLVDPRMVFDAARQRLVMVGYTPVGSAHETWEHDGNDWAAVSTATAPLVQYGRLMVFDAARGVTVLQVCGTAGCSTWEYAGVDWVQRAATAQVTPRQFCGMAFDPLRQRTVLFGGRDPTGVVLDDTWEYDGQGWTQVPTLASPGPRDALAMEFDASRGSVVLFGGRGFPAVQQETWEYDGTRWIQLATVLQPAEGGSLGFVFDAARQRLLLLSNVGSYVLEQGIWLPIPGSGRPAARSGHAVAADPVGGRILLFGGTLPAQPQYRPFGDTWELVGDRWYELTPLTGPTPRFGHGMAFDRARGCAVLFGGRDANGVRNDTWEFDVAWRARTLPSSPPARERFGIDYDAVRRRVVLFGGASGTLRGDLWEYDGSTWQLRAQTGGPSPRSSLGLCYDAGRAQTVVFGGATSAGVDGETWTWDGAVWQRLQPAASPPARSHHTMAYDPGRGAVLIVGGTANAAMAQDILDSWELRAGVWSQLPAGPSPITRRDAAMAHDAARGRTVLTLGDNAQLIPFFGQVALWPQGDAWELGPPSTATASVYGVGCPGSSGSPQLAAANAPVLGGTFSLSLTGVPSGASPVVFALGVEFGAWDLVPLPLDLAAIGLPGCDLWLAPIELRAAVATGGAATLGVALPAALPSGTRFAVQALSIDAAAPGAVGATSNAVLATAR